MIIANPIYDVVFKRLMEDERIAKFFIGTLLNETVEAIQVKPQEYTYSDELAWVAVYRVDFIATIKTATGEYKKVLIEIQKAKKRIDLMRFRNYLAHHFKKEDEIDTPEGKQNVPLPIVTIYLLGFSLPEIETSAVRVERHYLDLNTNQIIEKKSEFIEKLTHDCFVVQLPRIKEKYLTRLDKLLSVFEQAHFVDDTNTLKMYNHEIDEECVGEMTRILHHIGTDPAEKKHLEDEQEAFRVLDVAVRQQTNEYKAEILKTKKALEDKDKALEDKDKALEDNKKVLDDVMKMLNEQAKIIEDLKRKIGEK